ncbi:MAG: hypothetical protein AAB547_02110 [Patescibacteria group bacterium]
MKKLNQLFVAILAALMFVPAAQAADKEEEKANDLFAEVTLAYHARNKDSSFSKQLYLEKGIAGTAGLSVWGFISHESEFSFAYVGLGKKLGDWQLALGAGCAWYGDICHTTVNPWAYYEADGLTILLNAEHYDREKEDPWFYLGYVHKKLGDSLFIGAYGESAVGIGPVIGWAFNEKVKVWVAIPVASRPDEDRTKVVVKFSVALF